MWCQMKDFKALVLVEDWLYGHAGRQLVGVFE